MLNLEQFEKIVRLHEMAGSKEPTEAEDIRDDYNDIKADLEQTLLELRKAIEVISEYPKNSVLFKEALAKLRRLL